MPEGICSLKLAVCAVFVGKLSESNEPMDERVISSSSADRKEASVSGEVGSVGGRERKSAPGVLAVTKVSAIVKVVERDMPGAR